MSNMCGLIISDLHCGHEAGLTPPKWDAERGNERARHLYHLRRYAWDWLVSELKGKKFDFTIINGDLIDGKGEKSGGTEQLYLDRDDQAEMAAGALKHFHLGEKFISFGTPYHVGNSEDWERQIAAAIGATKVGGCDDLDVNGCIINYRHFIGGSNIPHGRSTAMKKEALWNAIWAARGEYPKAKVIIRSHVHYFDFSGNFDVLGIVTPALQIYGTKFGTRKMSGSVDFGYVVINIDKDGDPKWYARRLLFPLHAALKLQKSR